MTSSYRRASLVSCLALLVACGFAADTWASGFALQEDTAEGMGNAFAGQTAKAYDASTVYYNAAGMSRLNGIATEGTASWFAPSSVFHGSNNNPLAGQVPGQGATVSGIQGFNNIKPAATGAVFGVYTLNPDWRLGLSVDAPFGARVEYKEGWVGRYQGLALDFTDIEFAPAVSYKVNSHFSIGGGPRFDWADARFAQAINSQAIGLGTAAEIGAGAQKAAAGAQQAAAAAQQAAAAGNLSLAQQLGAQATSLASQASSLAAQATALQNAALGAGDGEGQIKGTDMGIGYALSAMYEIDDASRIGLTYRSRIFHTLSGPASFQTPAFFSTLPSQVSNMATSQDAKIKLTLPDSVHLGGYHDINKQWAVMTDVSWTDWSVFRQLVAIGEINGTPLVNQAQNWRNTWAASVGVNFKPDDKWTIHGGVAYDETPVKAAYRNTLLPDSNRYWVAGGVSYAITPAADVHMSYTHLFADKAPINETMVPAQNGMASPTGTLTGNYDNSADVISIGFGLKF